MIIITVIIRIIMISMLIFDHQGDVIPLSCEIKFTHEAEFLTWMVDGEIQVYMVMRGFLTH